MFYHWIMRKLFYIIKYNIKSFWHDYFSITISSVCLVLAALHCWQYHASGFNANCLYRFILFISVFPITLFCGRKSVYIILICFSLFATWINTFNNYTGFFCILLSCRLYRKSEKWLIIIYAINTFRSSFNFMLYTMTI